MNQALDRSRNFRIVAAANYFTDITTQQLYQQNVHVRDGPQSIRQASR